MAETKKDNRLNNIITDLKSGNHKKMITALKQLRKHGKATAIVPIVDVYNETSDEIIKNEITSFLFDLKDESSIPPLLSCIEDEKYASNKNTLISIFWQSGLDASDHISFFVKQAIQGDYLTCLETMTVIENFDATFEEEEIEDLKYDLDEAIETDNSEKLSLLQSLKSVLVELNVNV